MNERIAKFLTSKETNMEKKKSQSSAERSHHNPLEIKPAAPKPKAVNLKDEESVILNLHTRIPETENLFDVHCHIGSGSYSNVLLGTLKKERGLPANNRRRFAIKHHIPTSRTDRIMKELRCMHKMGGKENVVGVHCCIRYNESFAFIMPYLAHDRFQTFFTTMDTPELQNYMRNLLIALRHVHGFNVIHRDVKPGNFLYNRRRGKFLLIDFGLAQLLPTLETPGELNANSPHMSLPASPQLKRIDSGGDVGRDLVPPIAVGEVNPSKVRGSKNFAPRAGTAGYRPPEVLLKYADQTTAVDIWAAGVMLLCILSSVYPFFKAPNDSLALAEMVTIFGSHALRRTAYLLGRSLTLNQKTNPLDLRKLCVRFRKRSKFSTPALLKKYKNSDGSCEVCSNCYQFFFNCICLDSTYKTEPVEEGDDPFPNSAYDLLSKLLEVNPQTRITADEALKHPFFSESYDDADRN